MISTETTATTYPKSLFGALLRLLRLIVIEGSALVRAVVHRREVRQLLELDDRGLRDIGLIRNDVVGALSQPLGKDPSVVLLVRRVERRSKLRTQPVPTRRVVPAIRAKLEA